jgi:hypothetical protein
VAKLSIYKYVRTHKGWRYCKAAFHPNGKIKPNVVVVSGVEEKHTEGRYFLNFNNEWIDVGLGNYWSGPRCLQPTAPRREARWKGHLVRGSSCCNRRKITTGAALEASEVAAEVVECAKMPGARSARRVVAGIPAACQKGQPICVAALLRSAFRPTANDDTRLP